MRILHTSDWHLGRTLHGVDLLTHQAAYLDHLVEVVRAEAVDAVVVAGDVYDRAVPPVEAVTMLGEALTRISEHAPVVVTPGNHDSAIRLGFGASLMRDGVHLRARVADVGRPVELVDPTDGAPVLVYALPYLDPDAVRRELADGDGAQDRAADDDRGALLPGSSVPLLPRSHEAVMSAAMRRVRRDLGSRQAASGTRLRSVVMAHAFVVGGQASDSERDIRVGGVDSVRAGVFEGVDYVALGHLHGRQRLTFPARPDAQILGRPTPELHYSGSPLAYSFSEKNHRKASLLVALGPDGDVTVDAVEAPVPRRLAEVEGTLEDLLGPAGEPHLDHWVRVVVTDHARPADLYARVKDRFAHALTVEHRPADRAERRHAAVVTSASDPRQVAAEFVEHVTGAAPTPEELDVLRRAYEHVLAGERSA
ncbi:exonuclease SbcCD subunit D [Actinotalea sp. K2]|uniref:exonuclease SbcCD subunit D n=1 Tax=Actinotalea sp. K2 TaxID=2939438 RepID=UPI002017F478|nr:exonuclease SbcCD subunit D [Actinotalea sp. K2]MCL3860946.1 exonuclease SbcCD subunit D [Actinotalea sp. K2]